MALRNLHEHYDQLTEGERQWLDRLMRELMKEARGDGFPLAGDDRAEEATDALAKWMMSSRGLREGVSLPWSSLDSEQRRQICLQHPRPQFGYEVYHWLPQGGDSWARVPTAVELAEKPAGLFWSELTTAQHAEIKGSHRRPPRGYVAYKWHDQGNGLWMRVLPPDGKEYAGGDRGE